VLDSVTRAVASLRNITSFLRPKLNCNINNIYILFQIRATPFLWLHAFSNLNDTANARESVSRTQSSVNLRIRSDLRHMLRDHPRSDGIMSTCVPRRLFGRWKCFSLHQPPPPSLPLEGASVSLISEMKSLCRLSCEKTIIFWILQSDLFKKVKNRLTFGRYD
jgi:hypothetical protein